MAESTHISSALPLGTFNSCANIKPENITTPVGSFGIMAFVTYAIPIVSILGIIGNALSFVILKESALRLSSHFFLTCLTLFDTLSLVTYFFFWITMVLRPYYQYTAPYQLIVVDSLMSRYGFCQFRMFISFTCRTLSIWTIVLFTAERLVVVMWPLRSDALCTIRNACIAIGVMTGVALLVNLPWLFSFDRRRVPCSTRVACRANNVLRVNVLIETIFLSVIPAVIICVCNAVIISTLKRRQFHSTLHDKRSILVQQKVITHRLLAVSCTFVLLTFPSLIIISMNTASALRKSNGHKSGPAADVYHLAMFFFILNLSINFVLYCLTGPAFRRAAVSLLLCRLSEMRQLRKFLNQPGITSTDSKGTEVLIHTDDPCIPPAEVDRPGERLRVPLGGGAGNVGRQDSLQSTLLSGRAGSQRSTQSCDSALPLDSPVSRSESGRSDQRLLIKHSGSGSLPPTGASQLSTISETQT